MIVATRCLFKGAEMFLSYNIVTSLKAIKPQFSIAETIRATILIYNTINEESFER